MSGAAPIGLLNVLLSFAFAYFSVVGENAIFSIIAAILWSSGNLLIGAHYIIKALEQLVWYQKEQHSRAANSRASS